MGVHRLCSAVMSLVRVVEDVILGKIGVVGPKFVTTMLMKGTAVSNLS